MSKRDIKLAMDSSIISIIIPIILAILFVACKENIPDVPPAITEERKPFEEIPLLENMVIYEANPLVFSENGSIAEIKNKLGHIKSLGANVIWVMPIFPEGETKGVGSPYCIQDYTDVNPDYGTLKDFNNLVDEAHKMGMAVILDWVANHTSWDHPWIDNTDWYVQDTNGNIIIPPNTNWQDVAELNYNNQEMRLEMINAMKFWVEECNIDGFRCDAVDFVPFSFWKQALDSLKSIPNRNLILLAESGKTESYNVGFQLIYAWDFQSKMKDVFHNGNKASAITTTHKNEYAEVPSGKHRLRYTTNHDVYAWEESPSTAYKSTAGATTAFVITTFMGGVPLIYSGQEIGHQNTISFFGSNPLNWLQNPDVLKAYQKTMTIRGANTHLIAGEQKSFDNDNVVSFTRSNGSETIWVVANVRATESSYTVPSELEGNWVNLIDSTTTSTHKTILLKPFEYLIMKK